MTRQPYWVCPGYCGRNDPWKVTCHLPLGAAWTVCRRCGALRSRFVRDPYVTPADAAAYMGLGGRRFVYHPHIGHLDPTALVCEADPGVGLAMVCVAPAGADFPSGHVTLRVAFGRLITLAMNYADVRKNRPEEVAMAGPPPAGLLDFCNGVCRRYTIHVGTGRWLACAKCAALSDDGPEPEYRQTAADPLPPFAYQTGDVRGLGAIVYATGTGDPGDPGDPGLMVCRVRHGDPDVGEGLLAADRPTGIALAALITRALNMYAAQWYGRADLDNLLLECVRVRAAALGGI